MENIVTFDMLTGDETEFRLLRFLYMKEFTRKINDEPTEMNRVSNDIMVTYGKTRKVYEIRVFHNGTTYLLSDCYTGTRYGPSTRDKIWVNKDSPIILHDYAYGEKYFLFTQL